MAANRHGNGDVGHGYQYNLLSSDAANDRPLYAIAVYNHMHARKSVDWPNMHYIYIHANCKHNLMHQDMTSYNKRALI